MPQKRKGPSRRKSSSTPPRRKAGKSQTQIIMMDPNGQIQHGQPVPHLPSTVPHVSRHMNKATGQKRKASWVGESPIVISKFSWKYRWYLTPFVASAVVLWSTAVYPVFTLLALVALAGFAFALAQTEIIAGKRKLMSKNERLLVCYWCGGAGVSTIVELLTGVWAWQRVIFTLATATTYPTYLWLKSRQPTNTKEKMSKQSVENLKLWSRVGRYSEGPLNGSTIIANTAHEPTLGTLVFNAQLRADVHGESAESDIVSKKVEALLALPPKTVRIKCDTKNSTRIEVTMSVSQHLEHNVVSWPGPEMTSDNKIVLGDTPSGKIINVPRYNDKGVFHGRLTGNTGNGKTSTARVILTARANAMTTASCTSLPSGIIPADDTATSRWASDNACPEEVIWLLDGKRGTSMPEISNLFDWYAVTDVEWPLVLDTLDTVMIDRQLRRGKQKKSAWRPGTEEDPIITCYLAEASAVRDSLLARGLAKQYDRIVLALLRQGRALGISIWQESQDATAENWLGGRAARELMGKGAAVMHRPGGATGAQYAGDGAAAKVNLLKLPAAEGFAAVVANGEVLADVMRVRWCSEDASLAWAADYHARQLEGRDLEVAGKAYQNRTRGRDAEDDDDATELPEVVGGTGGETELPVAPVLTLVPEPVDERTDEEVGNQTDAWLLNMLELHKKGLTVQDLVGHGKNKRGRSQSNIYGRLTALMRDGKVTQDDDGKWKIP
jgi:hypothetical protein